MCFIAHQDDVKFIISEYVLFTQSWEAPGVAGLCCILLH